MSSPTKANRRAWTAYVLEQPEKFDELLAFVAEGGRLLRWCVEHDVPSALVSEWIQADKDRAERYNQACMARESLANDRLLAELEGVAFLDPAELAGLNSPDDVAKAPEHVRRAVVGWSWDKAGNFVLKLAKERALEMLGKHRKLFTDKLEVDASPELADALAKARQRLKDQDHA